MAKLKPHDPLADVRKDPLQVKSFELNPAGLRNRGFDCPPVPAFPRELFACVALERLEIFRGIDYDGDATIPAEIGQLRNLEELSLGGLTFERLPPEIGQLSKLKRLSLVYNACLEALPPTIGDLVALEELDLAYTSLKELPRTIGKLVSLKTLRLATLTELPAEVFELASLTSLTLPTSVEHLPPGLGKLAKLTDLSLAVGALAGAAHELPQLVNLRSLWLSGAATTLPNELGALRSLKTLDIAHLGLTSLPSSFEELTALEELSVAGNALPSLVALVVKLPKLMGLSFSDNPLSRTEKKQIEALMRLPADKRPAAFSTMLAESGAKKNPAKSAAKSEATTKESAAPLPTRLGKVTSVNASLRMLVADARVAASYQGISNPTDDEDPHLAGSDWDRLSDTLDEKDCARFAIGGTDAVALGLGVGQGQVSVWSVNDRLVLFEGIFAADEDDLGEDDRALFREFISSQPRKAKKMSELGVESGQLVLMPSTDSCDDVEALLSTRSPAERAVSCGSDGAGLMVALAPGGYELHLEKEVEGSWGSGRRCHVIPHGG